MGTAAATGGRVSTTAASGQASGRASTTAASGQASGRVSTTVTFGRTCLNNSPMIVLLLLYIAFPHILLSHDIHFSTREMFQVPAV